jgi:hypothetical protein
MTWVRALVALCVAACGRIGFDEVRIDGPPIGSSATFVQETCTSIDGPQTTMLQIAFDHPVVASDLLVVAIDFDGTTQQATVTDSVGNTFQSVTSIRSTKMTAQVWYAVDITDGLDVITLALDSSSAAMTLDLHEYSGVVGVKQHSSVSAVSNAPVTTMQPAGAGDLLFAYSGIFTASIIGVDPPFISRASCNNNLTADAVAPSAGNYAATFAADASNTWIATIVSFR